MKEAYGKNRIALRATGGDDGALADRLDRREDRSNTPTNTRFELVKPDADPQEVAEKLDCRGCDRHQVRASRAEL